MHHGRVGHEQPKTEKNRRQQIVEADCVQAGSEK
jgi:hypothetical protein